MFDSLPNELRALHQWVCWRYEEVEGNKPTKVPYNPRTGYPASVTDPATWCPFDYCVNAVAQSNGGYAGIGFVFTDRDPYCGIDLDHLQDDPEGSARQVLIFDKMDSYSERSPSGLGLHIIVKAHVPHGRKRHGIEVYSSGRFFTMTGDVYKDAPIADRQDLVQMLWSEMGQAAQPNYYVGDYTEKESDADVWDKAARAANGDLFLRLWNGDASGYFSTSEADFALIDIIAFYTKHRMQIQRMFLNSELGKRGKYAEAKPGRLSALMGYMINKSFDRMLPPVDISGVIDQFNAAQAERNSPRGADQTGYSLPRPALAGADQATPATPAPTSYDGSSADLWRSLPPPGLLGALTNYVYGASPRPVYEISLAAALGLMSGICGRAFNVSGTGLNHYIMCLANTGTGKEAMSSAINRLMTAVAKDVPSAMQFIGPADLASGQGLLKHLSDRETPCFVSLVGEVGLKLQQMTHPNASTSEIALRRVMLDLFNKSGAGNMVHPTVYSDKKNNTDVIHSPAFSLLGDSTPEVFYRALDEDSITQGLLPRFTIIEYGGPRVALNEAHANTVPTYDLITAVGTLAKNCHENMATGKVINITANDAAQALLREIDSYADMRINTADKDVLRQLWNRFHLKTLKLAGILAISVNFYEPLIDAKMVEWSRSLVLADTVRLMGKFQSGEIGQHNENSEQDAALRLAVKHFLTSELPALKVYDVNGALHNDKVVPYLYLQRRLVSAAAFRKDKRNSTQAIKAAIQNLIDGGVLAEVPPAQLREKYQFNGRAYAPVNPGWFLK